MQVSGCHGGGEELFQLRNIGNSDSLSRNGRREEPLRHTHIVGCNGRR